MKLNFVKAYAHYCAYCKKGGATPYRVTEFAQLWKENKESNHECCNYNYLEDVEEENSGPISIES